MDGPESPGQANRAVWDHPIQMHVRVFAVSDAGAGGIAGSNGEWRVGRCSGDCPRFAPAMRPENSFESLQQKHELEMVSGERLMAGLGRPISYHAGPKPYSLRVQFAPEWMPSGKLGLRVKPQLGMPDGSGITTKKYDAGLADTSSFLVQGFPNDAPGARFRGTAVSRPLLGTQASGDLRFHARHPADLPASGGAQRPEALGAGAFLHSGLSHHLPGGRFGRAHRMVHTAAHGCGRGWPKTCPNTFSTKAPSCSRTTR